MSSWRLHLFEMSMDSFPSCWGNSFAFSHLFIMSALQNCHTVRWEKVIYPCPHHEGIQGWVQLHLHILTMARNKGEWSTSHPSCFIPCERTLKTESFQAIYLHRQLGHLATLSPWLYHHSSSKRCHLRVTTAHHSVRTFWEDTACCCCCCSYTYTCHVYKWADWIWIQIHVTCYSQKALNENL